MTINEGIADRRSPMYNINVDVQSAGAHKLP